MMHRILLLILGLLSLSSGARAQDRLVILQSEQTVSLTNPRLAKADFYIADRTTGQGARCFIQFDWDVNRQLISQSPSNKCEAFVFWTGNFQPGEYSYYPPAAPRANSLYPTFLAINQQTRQVKLCAYVDRKPIRAGEPSTGFACSDELSVP
jgi:hypothetical protein